MANGKPIIRVDEEKALESNRTNANSASKKSLHKSSSREEQESLDVDPSEIVEEDEEYSPNEPAWMDQDLQRRLNWLMDLCERYPPSVLMIKDVRVPRQPKLFRIRDEVDQNSLNSLMNFLSQRRHSRQPEMDHSEKVKRYLEELASETLFESGEYDSHGNGDANKD